mmetsp:Transcript_43969/g.124473  ORF Transcript_43969/g.124473 Transcript_43969/m.124473 type:complete len:202 (-) Transcript_43969:47-652(-)
MVSACLPASGSGVWCDAIGGVARLSASRRLKEYMNGCVDESIPCGRRHLHTNESVLASTTRWATRSARGATRSARELASLLVCGWVCGCGCVGGCVSKQHDPGCLPSYQSVLSFLSPLRRPPLHKHKRDRPTDRPMRRDATSQHESRLHTDQYLTRFICEHPHIHIYTHKRAAASLLASYDTCMPNYNMANQPIHQSIIRH